MFKTAVGTKQSILIIEDDSLFRDLLRTMLASEGASVRGCETGNSALDLMQKKCFEVFVIDYRLPDMSGVEVARTLRSCCPSSFIIGISLMPRERDFLEAGADAFLLKPFETRQLISLIEESGHI